MVMAFFEPSTSWSLLPHDVQVFVCSFLPLSQRVALERVDTNFGEISEELFQSQETIPIEKEFEDRRYPYSNLIKRCPNLREFDFNRYIKFKYPGIYYEQIKPEMFRKGGDIFKSLPNIKSFKNIRDNAVQVVSRYLIDRYSAFGENEPFEYLETPFSTLEVVLQLYGLVGYKIRHISWPLINPNEVEQWNELINKLSIKDIESVDDGRCLACLSDFNYLLSKLLRKPGLKLKRIKANITQENFNTLSRCPTLTHFTPSICEQTDISNLVNYRHITHLDLLTGCFFKSLSQLGGKDAEINENVTEFFVHNGHILRTLLIPLSTREDMIHTIADCCINLRYLKLTLDLNIRPKFGLIHTISRIKDIEVPEHSVDIHER